MFLVCSSSFIPSKRNTMLRENIPLPCDFLQGPCCLPFRHIQLFLVMWMLQLMDVPGNKPHLCVCAQHQPNSPPTALLLLVLGVASSSDKKLIPSGVTPSAQFENILLTADRRSSSLPPGACWKSAARARVGRSFDLR